MESFTFCESSSQTKAILYVFCCFCQELQRKSQSCVDQPHGIIINPTPAGPHQCLLMLSPRSSHLPHMFIVMSALNLCHHQFPISIVLGPQIFRENQTGCFVKEGEPTNWAASSLIFPIQPSVSLSPFQGHNIFSCLSLFLLISFNNSLLKGQTFPLSGVSPQSTVANKYGVFLHILKTKRKSFLWQDALKYPISLPTSNWRSNIWFQIIASH